MSQPTDVEPTIIGPLTTTFTAPSSCSTAFGPALCETCTSAYRAQTCTQGDMSDATACWPPASQGAPTPTAPFAGWGYYSPGLICPAGYTSACSATAGGASDWVVEYSMYGGETAVGCCPSGFTCAYGFGQTCQSNAGDYATVSFATCAGNSPEALSDLVLPITVDATATTATASLYTITTYQIWAPMIELRWQSTDLSATSTSGPTKSTHVTLVPSVNSQTVSATPTSTTSAAAQVSAGLSTGDQVAIGLVVPVIILALLAFIATCIWRRRRKRVAQTSSIHPERRMPELGGQPMYEVDGRHRAQEMGSDVPMSDESHELLGNMPEGSVFEVYELPDKVDPR